MPPTDEFQHAVAKGKVAFSRSSGGYGLIETDDHDDDVSLHVEDIEDSDLEEGQEMELNIEETDKGP